MKVFKFGGASVKNADAIKNVARIISLYPNEKIGVVISAMGKTTNALEQIVSDFLARNWNSFEERIHLLEAFHLEIIDCLIKEKNNAIFSEVETIFTLIKELKNCQQSKSRAYYYSKTVAQGEVLSTKIINAFLIQENFKSKWIDAGQIIKTENKYLEANIDWLVTENHFLDKFIPEFRRNDILITQGFMGRNQANELTTLGREGSDFSAGIIAYCCNAESVTIWKDVPGMLNADPKWFENTVKLDNISFREAIELSYYGASVIHPKTIKPLQNKNIPLYVKSFVNPEKEGTTIHSCTSKDHLVPSFIFKENQILFSISPKDFSFIEEENLSDIFRKLSAMDVKINVMQNSALNLSIVLDKQRIKLSEFLKIMGESYIIKYNDDLQLITIRHYDQATIDELTANKEVILQQLTRDTARFLVKMK
mgnify:FL=1